MKILFLALILFIIGSCQSAAIFTGPSAADLYSTSHLTKLTPLGTAEGVKVAIASGGKFSSQAGLEIFGQGGNAVDAAVAISFCLAVERPHSLGLGGGGLMTLHLSENPEKDFFIDFRESAPLKASRNMYLDTNGVVIPHLSQMGAMAVAVPGFVAGMQEIHARWGRLPWKAVIAPAIRLARKGFPIYPTLAERILSEADNIRKDKYAASILMVRGQPPAIGTTFVQKDLAQTLELISTNGKSEFYEKSIAQKIVTFIQSKHGIISLADLSGYKVINRQPLRSKIFGFDIITAPPPSAGGPLLIQWSNVLSGYDRSYLTGDGVRYLHLLTETMKRGYADRSQYIGDPDFSQEPWAKIITPEYADKIRHSIFPNKATPSDQIKPGSAFHETAGTSHLSILDDLGSAVAITLSINDSFGARLAVPGTGIFLNNTMDDFSVRPGQPNVYGLIGGDANAIAPGKRPVSSTMPTVLLKDGQAVLAIGGAGGSRITSSVAQVAFNFLLLFPNDLAKSQSAPRIHHQWLPDQLELETMGFSEKTAEALRSLGHKIAAPPFLAKVQAVSRNPQSHILTAVVDPRDDGAGAAAR